MNYELFIAKRIIAGKEYKNSISSPIIKIANTAIALGIIIMLIAIATSTGLQSKIRDKMSGFKGHIQITNYDNNYSDLSTVPLDISQEFYPNFTTIDGIKNVQIFANKTGLLRTESTFEGVVVKGVSTDYDWSFFKEYLVDGRLPNFEQTRNREVLLSKFVADRLELQLNDTLQAWFSNSSKKSRSKFKRRKPILVGIYSTGFQEFDKSMMIGDIREVQRLNGWEADEIGGFEVLINNFDDLNEKGKEVYKSIPSTLNSQTIVENYPTIFDWIKLFDNNVNFIIAIMILIAGINMITALLVLILERVQMVGILKALGSSNWSVRKIFLYNATYLILQGLFWGNLIGLGLIFIQHYFGIITLDPETYYVNTVPVSISVTAILALNLGTLLLCLCMLIIPSYIITKIVPSKSIKFA